MGKTTKVMQHGDFTLRKEIDAGTYHVFWWDLDAQQTRRRSLYTNDEQTSVSRLVHISEMCADKSVAPKSVIFLEKGNTLFGVMSFYVDEQGKHLKSKDTVFAANKLICEYFGDVSIQQMTPEKISGFISYLKERGLKNGTISRYLAVLRRALSFSHSKYLIKFKPSIPEVHNRARQDAAPKKGDNLRLKELAELIDQIESPHILMYIVFLLNLAGRPSAILELQNRQIDWEYTLIDLNPHNRVQTHKHRPRVKIPDTLIPWLPSPGTTIGHLITFNGKPIKSAKSAMRRLKRLHTSGKNINGYSMRHTVGRYLRSHKVPVDQYEVQLGHRLSSNGVSDRYTLDPWDPRYLEDAKKAIEDMMHELEDLTKVNSVLKPFSRKR